MSIKNSTTGQQNRIRKSERVVVGSSMFEDFFKPVHLRFNGAWYAHHNSSCLQKAAAFTVGAALNAFPFVFLFHGRAWMTGGKVVLAQVLRRSLGDTASASMVAGIFVGSYCAINNRLGAAYVTSAAASSGLAASCFGISNPRSLPWLVFGGMALAVVVWTTTPVLQVIAQETHHVQNRQ